MKPLNDVQLYLSRSMDGAQVAMEAEGGSLEQLWGRRSSGQKEQQGQARQRTHSAVLEAGQANVAEQGATKRAPESSLAVQVGCEQLQQLGSALLQGRCRRKQAGCCWSLGHVQPCQPLQPPAHSQGCRMQQLLTSCCQDVRLEQPCLQHARQAPALSAALLGLARRSLRPREPHTFLTIPEPETCHTPERAARESCCLHAKLLRSLLRCWARQDAAAVPRHHVGECILVTGVRRFHCEHAERRHEADVHVAAQEAVAAQPDLQRVCLCSDCSQPSH